MSSGSHGGKRPGAGRRKGIPNKRTQEVVEQAAAAGMLPHEFLCAVAQGHEVNGQKPTFEQRIEAAKAAAPYYAPKLAAIEHSGAMTLRHEDALAGLE